MCAYNLMGLNTMSDDAQCYTGCNEYPIPCYGYALNVATSVPWTYPGMRSGSFEPITDCAKLKELVTRDGAREVQDLSTVGPNAHVFAGFFGTKPDNYHFARRDVDTQTWSSKNGPDMPTQNDNDGNPITDITKAHFVLNNE